MKFPFLNHPRSGLPDVMVTLVVLSVVACTVKLLLDGVTFAIHGHTVNCGHVDAMSYGSLLAPILGAHGYLDGKGLNAQQPKKVDDPDATQT